MLADELVLNGITYRKLFPGLARDLTDVEAVKLRETLVDHGILDSLHVVQHATEPDSRWVINGWQRLVLAGELGFGPAQLPEQGYATTLDDAKLLEVAVAFLVSGRQLTKEDRVAIEVYLKAKGLSNREIARQLGVSDMTVGRDLASAATNVAPAPATIAGSDDARRVEVAALADAGGTVEEIAQAVGASEYTVRQDLELLQLQREVAQADAREKLWRVRDWLKDDYAGKVGTTTPVWCSRCAKKQTLGSLLLTKPAA